MLDTGDLVFHPKHGFGTVSGVTRRDPLLPFQGLEAGDQAAGSALEYYDIELLSGGSLLVPVDRAERAGLRLLTNGLDAIRACLRSPAHDLPADARRRAAEIATRSQMTDATSLAAAVRDMLVHGRGRARTASEKAWLRKACERLSTEAALVDNIPRSRAAAAIMEEVAQLSEP